MINKNLNTDPEHMNLFSIFSCSQGTLAWIIQASRLVQTQDASSEAEVNYRELEAMKCLC